jgi:predicted metal-dependent peptidase
VTADETLTPYELGERELAGSGGSDLSPAMLRLAEDPEVRAAVVITDGDIAYPQAAMPYEVLWVTTAASAFRPPYGRVVAMT